MPRNIPNVFNAWVISQILRVWWIPIYNYILQKLYKNDYINNNDIFEIWDYLNPEYNYPYIEELRNEKSLKQKNTFIILTLRAFVYNLEINLKWISNLQRAWGKIFNDISVKIVMPDNLKVQNPRNILSSTCQIINNNIDDMIQKSPNLDICFQGYNITFENLDENTKEKYLNSIKFYFNIVPSPWGEVVIDNISITKYFG
jgi:hypothetical protein